MRTAAFIWLFAFLTLYFSDSQSFFHVWLQRETFWAVVFINCSLFKLCWSICGPGLWTSLVPLLTMSTLVHQPVLKTYGADRWMSGMWFLLGWRLLLKPTLFIYFSCETRNKCHTCYQWSSIYFRIFTASHLSFFFEERNSSWLLMLFLLPVTGVHVHWNLNSLQ